VVTDIVVSDKSQSAQVIGKKFTVITFAPVQGFIEKSRKLRDLYGASQILSYLSYCIVKAATNQKLEVISPAIREGELSIDLIQGMPNRILIVGEIERDKAFNIFRDTLVGSWQKITKECKEWVELNVGSKVAYDWDMSWKRWNLHAWEIFIGQAESIENAMRDLETRKLRRAWTVPNWNGESSSLSGYDAIAFPNMDREITRESKQNRQVLKSEIEAFYNILAEKLDPYGEKNDRAYINENERLSIPELIKRLVTYDEVRDKIDFYRVIKPEDKKAFEIESFAKLLRKDDEKHETYWTGWFMGDGDRIGNYLNSLTNDVEVTNFSHCLRDWGRGLRQGFDLGRVIYAGGDDFLGVIYGTKTQPQRDKQEVFEWLCNLRSRWEELRDDMRQKGLRVNNQHELNKGDEPDVSLSVGFVWAGHSVPQRDVLQHCREAEKRSKNLGRDRVTIRIVFNNGQFVEWTTPWKYLSWLRDYCDRVGNTGQDANWGHVYSDLAQLKARHAIPPSNARNINESIALELLKLYFGEEKADILSNDRKSITGQKDESAMPVIEWIESMIQVGWQLCSSI